MIRAVIQGGTSEMIFSFSRLVSFLVGYPQVFQQKRWITAPWARCPRRTLILV